MVMVAVPFALVTGVRVRVFSATAAVIRRCSKSIFEDLKKILFVAPSKYSQRIFGEILCGPCGVTLLLWTLNFFERSALRGFR
jgi:hypothetical protein